MKLLVAKIKDVAHCIPNPIKKTTAKTIPDAQMTHSGMIAASARKLQGILDDLIFGKQQKGRVGIKSGPPRTHLQPR